jgi:hypothetical protein
MKEDEMSGAFGIYGRVEKEKFSWKPERRDNLEDIDVGGKIILKCI